MQGGHLGDPSKMAAARYVCSNRQRQSMGRLPIYVYGVRYGMSDVEIVIGGCARTVRADIHVPPIFCDRAKTICDPFWKSQCSILRYDF